jgi:hypothetical protein
MQILFLFTPRIRAFPYIAKNAGGVMGGTQRTMDENLFFPDHFFNNLKSWLMPFRRLQYSMTMAQ